MKRGLHIPVFGGSRRSPRVVIAAWLSVVVLLKKKEDQISLGTGGGNIGTCTAVLVVAGGVEQGAALASAH